VGEIIASVEQHLALCPECREEYEALMKILKDGQ
jgi:predicted anti-sigma-YlaC factor YlaD